MSGGRSPSNPRLVCALCHPLIYTPGDNEWTDCIDPKISEAYLRIYHGQSNLGDVEIVAEYESAFARINRPHEWAEGVRRLVQEDYADAKRITLVMDNLNTHAGATLYKAFVPEVAQALLSKLEFVYTPKHGIWLNVNSVCLAVNAWQGDYRIFKRHQQR